MYQLAVKFPDGSRHEFPFKRGELRIGRDADNDVVLPAPGVSRRHARVFLQGAKVFVEDLASTAGIFIGGVEVRKAVEVRPGIPMGLDAYTLTVELEGGRIPGGLWGYLAGLSECVQGAVFPLDSPEMVSGRTSDNPVAIDDISLSRRHAAFRHDGKTAVVADLNSSNGTFVGGRRVKESPLADGDIVRLGAVDLIFKRLGTSPASRPLLAPHAHSRKSLLILLGFFLALALVVALFAVGQKRRQEASSAPAAEPQKQDPTLADRIREIVETARAKADKERWDDALAEVKRVLDKDPLNQEARALGERIAHEMAARKLYEEADMSAALGKLDDALRQYRSIARDSAYFARAAPKIKDAERRLSAGILKEARVMARRGPPLKVHEKLKEALEADPENAEALKMMRDAEALMKKRRIKFEAWEPPMKTGDGQGGRNPDAVLIDKYPEDAIRRCVVMYYLGKADEALKELGRLLADRKNKDLEEQIETLQRGIFFVRGKFTEGQGHMFQNNVRDAARLWKMALEADAKLVPESPPSYYRDEISRLLAEAYLKAGTQMYGKERYEEAFGQWKAAYDIAPDHVEVLHALKKLESTAERMFEETVTGAMPPVEKREKFELIKAITLPKTSVHQMAIQKLLEMK